jgi:hypothetical protein
VAREAQVAAHLAEKPARLPVGDGGFGQIGVHCCRADANQHGIIMRIEALG